MRQSREFEHPWELELLESRKPLRVSKGDSEL